MEEQRVAQQRSVSLIDDIDGTKAVETLTFWSRRVEVRD
jgi:hypothetical protein